MDLFDIAWACLRRWYIFVPLLAVSAWVSYNAYTGVQTVYYGSTTIGLSNPSIATAQNPNETRSNGLLTSGGATLLTNLLALGLSDPAVVERVAADGGLPGYEAEVFAVPGGQLPLVVVSLTADDPAAVKKTLDLVSAQGGNVMRGLQQNAGVPEDQMVTPYTVLAPNEPTPGIPSRTRATVALFLAGAGLTVVVTVLADLLLSRRTRRKGAEPDGSGDGDDTTEQERTERAPQALPDEV